MGVNELLNALADETRRKILMKLREGVISSGELASALNITPQALSYHLSKLKKAGLIYETKHKNFIYYEVDLTVLDEILIWIDCLKGEIENEKAEKNMRRTNGSADNSNCNFPVFPAGKNPGAL